MEFPFVFVTFNITLEERGASGHVKMPERVIVVGAGCEYMLHELFYILCVRVAGVVAIVILTKWALHQYSIRLECCTHDISKWRQCRIA